MTFQNTIKTDFSFQFLDFRSGKAPILVATDVAARGLGK